MELEQIHLAEEASPNYSRINSSSDNIGLTAGNAVGGASGPTNIATMCSTAVNGGDIVATTRFGRQWQNSSRIIRVSRASGGKDRHSKVWTAKGPRDRRVRLSVNTAIQFYDLQDRLGYDQPSKAVEWLIKAAAESINELPSLDSSNFPPVTPPLSQHDEVRSGNNNVVVSSADDVQMDAAAAGVVQDHGQQQLAGSMSRSGCSSNNSETSKGSGLSLSRTEIRVKARERARERTAKEKKEMESESRVSVAVHHSGNNNDQNSSFTQLLTAGISNLRENRGRNDNDNDNDNDGDCSNTLQWLSSSSCTATSMANYFGPGSMGLSVARSNHSIHSQQLGDGSLPHVMDLLPFSGGSTSNQIQHHHQHHRHQQQFPFFIEQHQHHHHPTDVSMSSSSTTSGVATGFNRGTLQSNSSSTPPSFLPYFQRFSTTDGGSSVPFFLGGAPISPIVENQHYHHDHHHHHQQQFNPAGLELSYGNGGRHLDHKGKEKN